MTALRPATLGDVPWIMAQERRPEFAAYIHRSSEAQHRQRMVDPDRVYLIAEDERGGRTGFALLAGRQASENGVELARMAVTEPGQGLGATLLEALLDWITVELAPARIWLDVFEDNERARRAYRRAGFVETERLPDPVERLDGTAAHLVLMDYRP
ncbi:MAG: GNAT family N-acetyltransferase [Methyloligellaceae bacterium]